MATAPAGTWPPQWRCAPAPTARRWSVSFWSIPTPTSSRTTSRLRSADDPFLFNRHSVAWYRQHYLADPADAASPFASPLRAGSLAGLPPALVITAEYDPLRDQGEAYARRLADEGVPVELSRYPGMVHGFFTMTATVAASRSAHAQAAARLGAWFDTAGPGKG